MVSVVFLLLLSVAGVAAASPAHNVTSGDVKIMLNKDKKIFLLDVRTVEEFRQARLRGATLIPIAEIERRYFEVPKDRPVVVYCAVGSRSGLVADFLEKKGYRQIYNMKDGIVGWYRSGYPLER
jgi:rhodanese-related sulfurtransferase